MLTKMRGQGCFWRERFVRAPGDLLWVLIIVAGMFAHAIEGLPLHEREKSRSGREGGVDVASLKELFRSPPSERRILQIIHNFPKPVSAHGRLLQSLKEQGFGGVVCNVHFDNYLRSEENWESFVHAVRMAKEMGMTLWLYDEKGYPSGSAGGIVLEGNPEWEAQGVSCASTTTDGSPVELKLPLGQIILAAAFRVEKDEIDLRTGVDLRKEVADDELLKWQPPGGRWMVMALVQQVLYEGTHAELNLHEKRRYPNILMKEAVGRFIEVTHREYAKRFPDLSETFEAIFTDEPSLMSIYLRPQPYPVIPWSPGLPSRFRQETGRDLIPLLPALFADAGPEGRRARCDFWRLIGEIVSESYFGQIQDWCQAHGIASTGHLLWEEDLPYHVGFYGDFFRCAERFDITGIDCLTSKPETVPFHVAKLIGSIADIRGCERRMSETSDHVQRYRPPGDKRPRETVSEAEIRGTCNLLYVCGINATTSYYSWAGSSVEEKRRINEYVGRLGVMLTGGEHVCDIAVFYPAESLWAHFVPACGGATGSPEVAAVNKTFLDVSSSLFRNQLDFDYLDARALLSARVAGDSLEVGRERYRILVFPRVDTLPLGVWQKTAQFWRGGGIVMAAGALPQNTPSEFPSEEVMKLTREVFGSPAPGTAQGLNANRSARQGEAVFIPSGEEAQLSAIVKRLWEPDCRTLSPVSPLRYTHRRMAGREIYFIVNDSPHDVEEELVVRSSGNPELWDPNTGQAAALEATPGEQSNATRFRLRIEGFGSRFVALDRAAEAKRK